MKTTSKEATIKVTVSGTNLSPKDKERKIEVNQFATATATVGLKLGATIPNVAYGNVKVEVFLSVPCYVEEIREVYKQVRVLAHKLVDHETAVVLGQTKE